MVDATRARVVIPSLQLGCEQIKRPSNANQPHKTCGRALKRCALHRRCCGKSLLKHHRRKNRIRTLATSICALAEIGKTNLFENAASCDSVLSFHHPCTVCAPEKLNHCARGAQFTSSKHRLIGKSPAALIARTGNMVEQPCEC